MTCIIPRCIAPCQHVGCTIDRKQQYSSAVTQSYCSVDRVMDVIILRRVKLVGSVRHAEVTLCPFHRSIDLRNDRSGMKSY